MTFEQKDNEGALFKNDRREKDSHPHAKGTIRINGVDYWLSAWTNADKNGNKYQSLKATMKQQQQRNPGDPIPINEYQQQKKVETVREALHQGGLDTKDPDTEECLFEELQQADP